MCVCRKSSSCSPATPHHNAMRNFRATTMCMHGNWHTKTRSTLSAARVRFNVCNDRVLVFSEIQLSRLLVELPRLLLRKLLWAEREWTPFLSQHSTVSGTSASLLSCLSLSLPLSASPCLSTPLHHSPPLSTSRLPPHPCLSCKKSSFFPGRFCIFSTGHVAFCGESTKTQSTNLLNAFCVCGRGLTLYFEGSKCRGELKPDPLLCSNPRKSPESCVSSTGNFPKGWRS